MQKAALLVVLILGLYKEERLRPTNVIWRLSRLLLGYCPLGRLGSEAPANGEHRLLVPPLDHPKRPLGEPEAPRNQADEQDGAHQRNHGVETEGPQKTELVNREADDSEKRQTHRAEQDGIFVLDEERIGPGRDTGPDIRRKVGYVGYLDTNMHSDIISLRFCFRFLQHRKRPMHFPILKVLKVLL